MKIGLILMLFILSFEVFGSALVFKDRNAQKLIIQSEFIFYGNSARENLAQDIVGEIEKLWNGAEGKVVLDGLSFDVVFELSYQIVSVTKAKQLAKSLNSVFYNFVRLEKKSTQATSHFTIGGNSSLMVEQSDLGNSTTAAHEFGHGLGLRHETVNDWRGLGNPGIMGEPSLLVDTVYQVPGKGIFDKYKRIVTARNIKSLGLEKLKFNNRNQASLGNYDAVIEECISWISYEISRRAMPNLYSGMSGSNRCLKEYY